MKAARCVWRGAFGTGQSCTSPGAYPTLNKAGLYVIKEHNRYFLEPYRFVKFATREFISFLNQYFAALDYEELLSADPSLKQKVEETAKPVPGIFNFDASEFQDTALGY